MNHYPDLPNQFLQFFVNEDFFHNGRDVMESVWPFLEQHRGKAFKIDDLGAFYGLSGSTLMQLLHYLLNENIIYFSSPYCDYGSWEHQKSQQETSEEEPSAQLPEQDIDLSVNSDFEEEPTVSLDIL